MIPLVLLFQSSFRAFGYRENLFEHIIQGVIKAS